MRGLWCALVLRVAAGWFPHTAPGGAEFNASGHRSDYLALMSRAFGVKGSVVGGLQDASRYFSVVPGGGVDKGEARGSRAAVVARSGAWPHADPSTTLVWRCSERELQNGHGHHCSEENLLVIGKKQILSNKNCDK